MSDSVITLDDGHLVQPDEPCPNCGGKLTIAKPGRGWGDFLVCADCGVDHGEIVYVD